MSVFQDIDNKLVETVAVAVLYGGFSLNSDWQKGWLDGYAKAYNQITGKSIYQLVAAVNNQIYGSGKELKL